MGSTAASSKPSRTGTLSFAGSAIVTSVFRITWIPSSHPLLLQVSPPNLLCRFGSCLATGSPVVAIFSTSKVIYSNIFHRYIEVIPASLCWSSRGTASLEQFSMTPNAITLQHYTILYYIILYYTILYYTILYYTILYYTILYHTILYYTTLYYTILYYTILYYTILYYTILYTSI